MAKSTTCSIDGCEGKVSSRGWCETHYGRYRSNGDPLVVQTLRNMPLIDRFRAFSLEVEGGCIEWQGFRHRGYGKFQVKRKSVSSHRWIWEYHNGPIPSGLLVRHKCDNPPCVNPDHMELGTNMDNARDMVTRGRSMIGSTNHEAKLDEAKVLHILRSVRDRTATQVDLAETYGVSPGAIAHIVHGRSWKHVKLEDAA